METIEEIREERSIYELFRFSVILKGLISVAEVIAGIAFLFITPSLVQALAALLTHAELASEPYDFIASHIIATAEQYTSYTSKFLSVYLLSRGLVKSFLIWALLRNKLWAYPASLIVLSLFVLYQLYQIITEYSWIVVGITLFDLVVMYFIWREYKIVESHLKAQVA